MSDLEDIDSELVTLNIILRRIANALERIASAFEPAKESLDAGPAQPEVGGVAVADD
jgi:uncharacterized protein YukE